MRANGIVRTRRGPGGGLALARPAHSISLLSILEAVDAASEAQDVEWLTILPPPYGLRLQHIERRLFRELSVLSLADLTTPSSVAGLTVISVLPPLSLIGFVGRQAAAAAKADRCSFYFGNSQSGFLTTAYEAREVTDEDSSDPLVGRSAAGRWFPYMAVGVVTAASQSGLPVFVSDVMTDRRPSRDAAHRANVRAVSAIPIPVDGAGWGVMIVAKEHPHNWRDDEIAAELELAEVTRLAIIGYNHLANDGSSSPICSQGNAPDHLLEEVQS